MKITTITLEDRIDLAIDWFLNSGIQSDEGGFYAWQDMEDRSRSYLYSEITGYAITFMCFLYRLTKNDIYIERAEKAAKWVLGHALDPSGGVLTRRYLKNPVEHYSFERGNIYSFDCAMVAFGMLKLYKITHDKGCLGCADKIVDFLNDKMLKENGLYYPIFDTRGNKAREEAAKWSTQSGSFHCKLALCLCDLAAIKKDMYYNVVAKKLIDSSITHFYKGNRFITGMADGTSHLHPYCYTLEGMLYYSNSVKGNDYKYIIEDAFMRLLGFQDADGAFPTQVFSEEKTDVAYQRSDIQAQVLRLSCLTGPAGAKVRGGIKSGFRPQKLLDRLLELQNISENYRGGFLFGRDENGIFKKHSNAWCSMFAVQALYLASGKSDKDVVLEYMV